MAEELNRQGEIVPRLGSQVFYTLSADDVKEIEKRRRDFDNWRGDSRYEDSGLQAHVGNPVKEGMYFPAIVVSLQPEMETLNLRVILDGTDNFWATSRKRGRAAGNWVMKRGGQS